MEGRDGDSIESQGDFQSYHGPRVERNFTVEKAKYFKKLAEAYGLVCLSISRDFLFHLDSLTPPKEVWEKLEFLFGKTDELCGHQLENELIRLSPMQYDTIQDFFTKFKSLVL